MDTSEMIQAIRDYQVKHPEVEGILKRFSITQEVYEKALAAMMLRMRRGGPTYTLTTEGTYNANVSRVAR